MSPIPPVSRSLIPASFQYPYNFALATTAIVYVLSELTGNVSQVDRIWTFLPTIYTAYWALLPLWPTEPSGWFHPYTPKELSSTVAASYSPRALLMLGLTVIWSFSYNTYRRGLFSLKDEDYRWAVLREKIPTWFFKLTNLFFIAIIQNIILFLLGIPTHMAIHQPHTPLVTSDYILAALCLITLAVEFTADNQQYSFQIWKHHHRRHDREADWPGARINWTAADAQRGFVTRGLWAWSRHPNFACEQLFWVFINLFPILAKGAPPRIRPRVSFDPADLGSVEFWLGGLVELAPLAPCIVLCILFTSSTWFTEGITLKKYPKAYAIYRSRVAKFVPLSTPLKGLLLRINGQKEKVDKYLFGASEPVKVE